VAHAQAQTVSFAKGKIEVSLPGEMRVVRNEKQTLVALFGPRQDHQLELTLHEDLLSASAPDAAEQFVRERAQSSGRRLHGAPGKVAMLEPGDEFIKDGKPYKSMHSQVGFGKLLVVITISGPQALSPELRQFLSGPLTDLVLSLRRREA
jgi:hypothetical protein